MEGGSVPHGTPTRGTEAAIMTITLNLPEDIVKIIAQLFFLDGAVESVDRQDRDLAASYEFQAGAIFGLLILGIAGSGDLLAVG